jgi:hypothetical protein
VTERTKPARRVVGWREWASLPDLGVTGIKAKVDTGARTSCLHAFDVELVGARGKERVRFSVHPHQRDQSDPVLCELPLFEQRWVRSSNGKREYRPVVQTELLLGGEAWTIQLTLTSRDLMGFRMLLGREGLRRRVLVNPARSFLLEKEEAKRLLALEEASPAKESRRGSAKKPKRR